MPNPGTFLGSRGTFLEEQKDLYARAVKDGNANDVVSDIQRRYFKRFPMTLAHDEEPSKEWLDQVNDDAPDPEIESPNVAGMSPEDAGKVLDSFNTLIKNLKLRKDSIRRRLHYMYTKDHGEKLKGKIETDPMNILMARLTGIEFKPPRMKTAYNVWGPQHRELVDPVFNQRVEDDDVPAAEQIALRSAIYKELFNKLPQDERDMWTNKANRDHEKALRDLRKKFEDGVSTAPQDRQRAINRTPTFIEPILDLLAELTGWKWSLTGGGPEPADGGRLNMISIHSGVIPGTVKMDFGASEFGAFKEKIRPAFGSFLKKAYTVSECRSRALPEDYGIPSISEVTQDENDIDVTRFEIDKEHVEASKSHKQKRLFESVVGKKSKKPTPTPEPGVPSPPIRIGPPVGKAKLRVLPSKDKPSGSTAPAKSSPLTGDSTANITSNTTDNPPPTSITDVQESVPSPMTDAAHKSGLGTKAGELSAPGPIPDALNKPQSAQASDLLAADRTLSAESAIDPMSGAHDPLPLPQRLSSAPFSHPGTLKPSRPGTSAPSRPGTPPPLHSKTHQLSHPGALSQSGSPVPSRLGSPVRGSCPGSPAPSLLGTPHRTTHELSRPGTPRQHAFRATTTPATQAAEVPLPAKAASSPHYTPMPLTVQELGPSKSSTPAGAVTVPHFPDANTMAAPADIAKLGPSGASASKEKEAPSTASAKRKASTDEPAVTPSKKQRTSGRVIATVSQMAFKLDIPDDCAGWAGHAVQFLARKDLGPTWRQLVSAWISFEEKSAFAKEGQKLSSVGRPVALAEWIKNARRANFIPKIGDLDVFESTFIAWWSSVQPEWRKVDGDNNSDSDAMQQDGKDWSALSECHGVNGLLTVMAALLFWGSAPCSESQRASWSAAVADVHHVLRQIG